MEFVVDKLSAGLASFLALYTSQVNYHSNTHPSAIEGMENGPVM
jgi:hypothetical protein